MGTLFAVVLAPTNTSPPLVLPSSAGSGVLLTSTSGVWFGSPTPTYTYAWRKNGVANGSTGATYTTVVGDIGANIDCLVTATNSQGSASADSNDVLVSPPGGDFFPNRYFAPRFFPAPYFGG